MPAQDPIWLQVAQAAEHAVTTAALLIGGVWAYYRFGALRESQTALDIDLHLRTVPYRDQAWLVFLEIILTNKGKVKLTAMRSRSSDKPAYNDQRDGIGQEIRHSLNVEVRAIQRGLVAGAWIDPSKQEDTEQLKIVGEAINPLTGYTDTERGGVTDFWMEPGERYVLGVPLILGSGSYLAKVTFIGSKQPLEFWQRDFLVQVPTPNPVGSESADAPAGGST
jgi:hypothetical protein